jgi:cysteine desulfurase
VNTIYYFDNNATTKVSEGALAEMLPFFTERYGNPSSMHTFGGQNGKAVENAREQVADLIGAYPDEIVFTSCGTESDNAAIMGILNAHPEKRHIITTKVEHPAVKNLCDYLKKQGYKLSLLPVDKKGALSLQDLNEAIQDDTAIISLMWANNETGVLFPVEEAAKIAKKRGVFFHTDAVQAVGKIPINMRANHIDLLALSGHKLHAPKGVGALYIRRGVTITPFLRGGHQEHGRRGGTENVPSIVGLGKACEEAKAQLEHETQRIKALRDKLENALLTTIQNAYINGDPNNRIPNTSSVSFEFIEGEAVLLLLNELGICASSGSACTSGSLEPSHVLRAMGVPYTCAHGSIRFSLSRFTTEQEVDYVLEKTPSVIERLRTMSPFWQQYKKSGKTSFMEAAI